MSERLAAREACAAFEEKGSRFLARLIPVASATEIKDILSAEWQNHPKASHVVYGWRLRNGQQTEEGFSDDGEPSGSAGMPVLRQLQHACAVNVLLLVTRYFGGTRLGTGGLQRTYSQAAREAVGNLQDEEWTPWVNQVSLIISAGFADETEIRRQIGILHGVIRELSYTSDGIRLVCSLAETSIDGLVSALPRHCLLTTDDQAVRD